MRTIRLLIGFFALVCAWPAESQEATLKLKASPDVTAYWKVVSAKLMAETQGTTGSLEVQNLSDAALGDVVFYAEYFDKESRLSFSLVFSQANNVGNAQSPIAAGATRLLYSAGVGMVPASAPTDIHIHLLQQARVGENPKRFETITLEAPVTLGETIRADKTSVQLELSSKELASDLVLARLNIGQDGEVRETKILNTVSPQVEDWFQSFVHDLNFYPATSDGRPSNADTFVSVRVLSRSSAENPAHLIPEIAYVDSLTGAVPPVNRILLGPAGAAGTIEVVRIGSEWSDTAYKWVRDESMPRHLARQLAGNSSQ